MDLFDLSQSFIEATVDASMSALSSAFQTKLENLGFRYFACCSHVDPSKIPPGAVVLHNYPEAWSRTFIERKLHAVDPVLQYAERALVPFMWDTPEFLCQVTPLQMGILAEATDLGIERGFTIPIHLPWTMGSLRASCSLIPDSDAVEPRHFYAAQLMAMYLYAAASRGKAPMKSGIQKRLSQRERQCLEYAARGKSDWEIGQLLSISEHTAHAYIEHCKQKLGVSTRIQAVIHALESRQVSFGDVLRADGWSSEEA